jgi:hypothetical protein
MDDYIVPLPRGYRYFYHDSGIIIELHPIQGDDMSRIDRMHEEGLTAPRVGPNVDGYRVYRHAITGHVSKPNKRPEANLRVADFSATPASGYFVIDIRTDRTDKDLTKEQWIKRLLSMGITREPRLYVPSRFDEYLGRNKPGR